MFKAKRDGLDRGGTQPALPIGQKRGLRHGPHRIIHIHCLSSSIMTHRDPSVPKPEYLNLYSECPGVWRRHSGIESSTDPHCLGKSCSQHHVRGSSHCLLSPSSKVALRSTQRWGRCLRQRQIVQRKDMGTTVLQWRDGPCLPVPTLPRIKTIY